MSQDEREFAEWFNANYYTIDPVAKATIKAAWLASAQGQRERLPCGHPRVCLNFVPSTQSDVRCSWCEDIEEAVERVKEETLERCATYLELYDRPIVISHENARHLAHQLRSGMASPVSTKKREADIEEAIRWTVGFILEPQGGRVISQWQEHALAAWREKTKVTP